LQRKYDQATTWSSRDQTLTIHAVNYIKEILLYFQKCSSDSLRKDIYFSQILATCEAYLKKPSITDKQELSSAHKETQYTSNSPLIAKKLQKLIRGIVISKEEELDAVAFLPFLAAKTTASLTHVRITYPFKKDVMNILKQSLLCNLPKLQTIQT
jgi:hypothetical protein